MLCMLDLKKHLGFGCRADMTTRGVGLPPLRCPHLAKVLLAQLQLLLGRIREPSKVGLKDRCEHL